MKELKWENLKECLQWADKMMDDPEDHHGKDYWWGYSEALQMIACNVYPKEFFNYLMDKWVREAEE